MKFSHQHYTYDAVGIKSISPMNPLVTQHRRNDHQRWIVVHGDGDHDLCTRGSYAEATVGIFKTHRDKSASARIPL
jgi:hypothetical protein